MNQIKIFDGLHLKSSIEEAVTKNCKIEMRVDGTPALCFQGVSDIRILPEPQSMQQISKELGELASQSRSSNTDLLARLMTQAAIIASYADIRVLGPPNKPAGLGLLQRKICIDFSLVCSISLAHTRGYLIPKEGKSWEVMRSVLMVKDDDSLVQMFRTSLVSAIRPRETGSPARNSQSTGRGLSPESMWNLMSEAGASDWDDSITLQLIQEYLSPPRHPDLVHYANTFSGEEWRQLYEYIYRFR